MTGARNPPILAVSEHIPFADDLKTNKYEHIKAFFGNE